MCASPRTWNTKPISRNTRLDTSGHGKKYNQATSVATTTREKKIHRIAKIRGKKSIQITNNTTWYIRRLDCFLNNCVHVNFSLDYSIQLIFNFRFPILNWLLGWRNKTLKNARKMSDILLCPFPVVVIILLCARESCTRIRADETYFWYYFSIILLSIFLEIGFISRDVSRESPTARLRVYQYTNSFLSSKRRTRACNEHSCCCCIWCCSASFFLKRISNATFT